MTKQESAYHKAAKENENAVESKLFGKSCYKINGKAFCCFFQEEMVFKLEAPHHAAAMLLDGAQLFDPSGKKRPMKEWVQIPAIHKDQWPHFCSKAFEYIDRLSK